MTPQSSPVRISAAWLLSGPESLLGGKRGSCPSSCRAPSSPDRMNSESRPPPASRSPALVVCVVTAAPLRSPNQLPQRAFHQKTFAVTIRNQNLPKLPGNAALFVLNWESRGSQHRRGGIFSVSTPPAAEELKHNEQSAPPSHSSRSRQTLLQHPASEELGVPLQHRPCSHPQQRRGFSPAP